jgi:hypothetical protein
MIWSGCQNILLIRRAWISFALCMHNVFKYQVMYQSICKFNADFKYIKNLKIRYMLKKLYYFELDNSLNVKYNYTSVIRY